MNLTSFSISISERALRARGFLSGLLAAAVGISFLALATASCSDSGATAPPQVQPGGPALTSTPSSASVGNGTSQTVSIAGGQEPYTIIQIPLSSLARAVWVDSAHTPASLTIFGAATVATGSTSVIIRDSSPSTAKSVTIPIIKN